MGLTLTPVPFYTTDIVLDVHTSSRAQDCGRRVRLARFIGTHRARLDRVEERNEYFCRRDDGEFIQGKEVSS